MITTKTIKIEFTNDAEKIENTLKTLGIEPLRWAIVGVTNTELEISVSYALKDCIQTDNSNLH